MDDEAKACMATPAKDLRDHVMNVNIAKSEAEWWARAEIERLEALLATQPTQEAPSSDVVVTRDDQCEALKRLGLQYWPLVQQSGQAAVDKAHHTALEVAKERAALASTAGLKAENERLLKRSRELEEALKDAAYALSWAARKMQGHCRGSDVSATMLAAGNATQARTALGSDQ